MRRIRACIAALLLCFALRANAAPGCEHIYNEAPDIVLSPLCDASGGKVWYCTVCNAHHDPDAQGVKCELLAPAHAWNAEPVYLEADCVRGGAFCRECTRCGALEMLWADTDAPALGHAWEETAQAASCLRAGRIVVRCARCGQVESDRENPAAPALGHDLPAAYTVIQEAACTVSGTEGKQCARCGEYALTRAIAAKGHTEETLVLAEPTCLAAGAGRILCAVCGEILSDNVPLPKAAVCESEAITLLPPACARKGLAQMQCKWCGKAMGYQVMPCAHTWQAEETLPADCKQGARRARRCALCGALEILQTDLTPALGHDVTYHLTDETCVSCALLHGDCTRCGETLLTLSIDAAPARGHRYEEEITVLRAPACDQPGAAGWPCAVCGEIRDEIILSPTGHTPKVITLQAPACNAPGRAQSVCQTCGKVLEEAIPLPPLSACEAGAGIVLRAPRADTQTDGLTLYTCRFCGRILQVLAVPYAP